MPDRAGVSVRDEDVRPPDGPVLSAEDARVLTDQIKVGVEGVWMLVKQAYELRAWAALGYASWDDYCTREFGTARLRLPREERQEVVASLRDSGLSDRAIESATGVSRRTLIRDRQREVVTLAPPEESDWRQVATERGIAYVERQREAERAERRVTGTDGKSYAPAVPKPRRSPLADDAKNGGWQLRKSVERLVRISEDDRFAANKEQVATHLRDHLLYAVEVCQDLLDTLKESQ